MTGEEFILTVLERYGVPGLLMIVVGIVLWNTSRSNTSMIKGITAQLAATLDLLNKSLQDREKDRMIEAENRHEDIKRNEENFAAYESLVTTIATNHQMLAQNQAAVLGLLDDIKGLFVVNGAVENRNFTISQRIEDVVKKTSEATDKNAMTLNDVMSRLSDILAALKSLEAKVAMLQVEQSKSVTKAELADIQRQIGDLKAEVATLTIAVQQMEARLATPPITPTDTPKPPEGD